MTGQVLHPTTAYGDFVDGVRARVQRVEVETGPSHFEVRLPDGKRLAWAYDDLRALPDQADPGTLLLTNATAPLARLAITDKTVREVLGFRAKKLHRKPPVEHKRRIVSWAAGAVVSVALIVFVLVPIMANQLAVLLPPAGEKALGDATFEQIRTSLGDDDRMAVGICEAPDGLAALDAMIARLDAEDDLPYPLEVTVLDHDLVNAFAMPGGRVVLFRGLIDEASGPDEVAAVLAHEIGHVVNRDPTRDALRLAGSVGVLGLLFGDFAGGTVVLLLTNELINAKYSQAAETGADDYAHALLTEAELPPSALGTFFERLHEEHGDAEGIYAHFSTHPQMTARIEAAQAAEAERTGATRPALTPGEWRALGRICDAGTTASVPADEKAPASSLQWKNE